MDGESLPYRSVSQINTYKKCPYRYYLERVEKVWQRPAAWAPQGTALHFAVEMWERGNREADLAQMQAWFLESYSEEINKLTEQTPNLQFWFPSGPYKGMDDITRRRDIGLQQVQAYREYRLDPNQDGYYNPIYEDEEGKKYIEYEFNGELGGVPVRGFIDQVDIPQEGHELRVVDVKSGKDPGDARQLKVYQIFVREQTGLRVTKGAYWMARTGKAVEFDLTKYPDSMVIEEFQEVDEEIRAENFMAKPEPKQCMFCSVANSCQFKETS